MFKNMRAGVSFILSPNSNVRFAPADMELIHCDEIGGHQLVGVFADAPQLLRDCISRFEVFAVMASTRLAIVLTSEVVRYILECGKRVPVMSALPPKADMCGATRHVRFVRIADIVRHAARVNPRIDFTAQNPEIDRPGEKRFQRHSPMPCAWSRHRHRR